MPLFPDEKRRAILRWTGVKLSKDGKCIFNYNPGIFQSGLNFLIAHPCLPGFVNRGHIVQLLTLYAVMEFYMRILSDASSNGPGSLDMEIRWCYDNMAGLSRFVLGLFVSLVLSKTYYANRSYFGTVFGCSMGLAQMTVSWVRVPPAHSADAAAQQCARSAQRMIIRWVNAAFRLMWLEAVPGVSPKEIGKEMVGEALLTQAEWDKILTLSSRCTHIYQWISDVLADLLAGGYIASSNQLVMLQKQVDDMRGANVWGLPSLPMAYTQLITHMVKMHVLLLALNHGSLAAEQLCSSGGDHGSTFKCVVFIYLDMAVHHYLYQGLLDLHGALYSPNAGIYLGHMPALNFMDFVRDVTTHLFSESDSKPYTLNIVRLGGSSNRSVSRAVLGQHPAADKSTDLKTRLV